MQKSQVLFVLSLLLAVVVTAFALINSRPVVVNVFVHKFAASLALVIFVSAMLGALVVMSLGVGRFIGFKLESKRLNKEKAVLLREKDGLLQQINDLHKRIAELTAASTSTGAQAAAAPGSAAMPQDPATPV